MSETLVPFGDLGRQNNAIAAEITAATRRVLESGWYILGTEVSRFESAFAAYCGAGDCVGVANGSDALYLALTALGVGPGDEVITVANAGTYQTAAILQTGASVVFADIDPKTQTMDPGACAAAITSRTRAVLPVHLYGRMADMAALGELAECHGLALVEDAAQAHGAWLPDAGGEQKRAGAWGSCACFSFYPSKNLGALGDGGAVVTDDAVLAERLRRLRQYGWSRKYVTAESGGRNSRLDEMQAAILRVKLASLDGWNLLRRELAAVYDEGLAGVELDLPADEPGHVYHLYVVASDRRDDLREHLTAAGIQTDVHYPVPVHLQPVYAEGRVRPPGPGTLRETERQAQRILSLPLYAELTRRELDTVVGALHAWNAPP